MSDLIQKMKIEIRRFSPIRTNTASVVSSPGPFDLSGSDWVLNVTVDGGPWQVVNILQSAFSDPSSVSASALVTVINAALTDGEAFADSNGAVVLGTSTQGDSGSVEVSGDAVTGLLGFSVTSSTGGGFDDVFGSIKAVDDGTQEGTTRLREKDSITLRCQVDRNDWGSRRMAPGGPHETKHVIFTIERSQLRRKGLLNSLGLPDLHVGDRIVKLTSTGGTLVESFEDPNGLWIQDVTRAGHGRKAFGERTNRLFYLLCSEDRVTR